MTGTNALRGDITRRPRRPGFGLAVCALLIGGLAACDREVILPGERFDTRTPLEDTIPGEGGVAQAAPRDTDRAAPISLPAPERVTAWTSRGFSDANRIPHLALSAAPSEVWATDIGDGSSRRNRISVDPVANAGRVYTIDADAQLQATAVSNGAILWQADLTPEFDRGGFASGGGLALAGEVLYATTAQGEVIALDAGSGAIRWRQRLGTILGAPVVADGIVYVVGQNSEAWAVDAADGRLRWQIPVPSAQSVLIGGAAPAVAGGRVILPFPTGQILAVLPQTGVEVWGGFLRGGRLGVASATVNDITADPVVVGGTLYVGNQGGRVAALSLQTGDARWTAGDGAYSPVMVAGDGVFFVSDRNELIRLDADTGARVWGTELPFFVRQQERRRKAVFTHYGPLLAGGQLVVASGDGVIRFFSPESGELIRSLPLRGGAASHPIVVENTLLVVSEDGRLHAYR